MIKQPVISVIIPAYNEWRDIGNCIESLKNQTYKNLEIIIVDDGSTDKTRKLLKKIRGIKLLTQEHKGPGAARNKGVKRAKGEILVFVDSDMTFEKNFIKKLTLPIRQGKAIGTFSKEEFVSNDNTRWSRYWSINQGWKEGKMHPQNYPKTQKVFRAIRKDEFDSVNGFDTDVGYTDDWTLAEKLKTKAVHAESAIFFHRNPEGFKETYEQSKWMAKRPYKLGFFGKLIALIRVTLPFSFLIGLTKAVRHKSPLFLLYKHFVDTAQFNGIVSTFISKNRYR